jgi:hypothetical protein
MRCLTVARRAATRLRLPIWVAVALGALVTFPSSLIVTAQTPSAEPLVQASNFVYQGAFRLPAGGDDQHTFNYGGTALAFDSRDGGLWIVGHAQQQRAAEVTIPAPSSSTTLTSLPLASLKTNFSDLLAGKLGTIGSDESRIGGILPWGSGLIVSAYIYYDGAHVQQRSHFSVQNGSVSGPYQVGSAGAGFVSGYMTAIPPEWQGPLGGPALTGQCCIPIISRTSLGPAATVFDPSALSNQSKAVQVVGYPIDHPTLGTYEDTNPNNLFLMATAMSGIVFPSGTRSVLFIGTQPTTACYGEGTSDASKNRLAVPGESGIVYCYDPTSEYKGNHGYPYKGFVWAYDANDLAAVKSGKKSPWQVTPYATWQLNAPFMSKASDAILGAAYDPATRRVFVSLGSANGEAPVIAVYALTNATASADSTPPSVAVTSPSNGATVSGTVTLSASASDNVGVSSVWFTVDNINVGSEDGSAPYQTTWNTASAGNGTHTIRAAARDSSGNARTSSPVTVTVAGSTAQSTACTTPKPVANWVCVGTGWLPPDHPLAIAAGLGNLPSVTPPPAQMASSSSSSSISSGTYVSPIPCTTQKPVSNWVCVEGGWLPPDHPLAIAALGGGSSSSGTGSSGSSTSNGGSSNPGNSVVSNLPYCSFGGSPVAGWVYVSNGWVPPDHPLAVLGTCRAH